MSATPTDVLDRETVAGLVDAFDTDGLRDLVNEYLIDAERLLRALDAAVVAGDARAIYDAAHQLKSTSELLGARDFANRVAGVEQAGRSGVIGEVPEVVKQLRVAFGPVASAIRAIAPH